jgi:hypothetical protein
MVMSGNVIFMGWNHPVAGREAQSTELFQEFLQYLGGLQQAGTIESFEPVFLDFHGGDMNGFVLLRGKGAKLDALQSSEEWLTYMTRAGFSMEGLGIVRGVTGEMLMEQMNLWNKVMST